MRLWVDQVWLTRPTKPSSVETFVAHEDLKHYVEMWRYIQRKLVELKYEKGDVKSKKHDIIDNIDLQLFISDLKCFIILESISSMGSFSFS
jgi:hypothetical protein